jgi:hypothetical protein
MKFMVSLITDETSPGEMTPETMKEMQAFMGELQGSGALVDMGAKLGPSADARTLRYGERGRAVVTDGPFAESKEQLAGYMVLECEDADEALAWAERMPLSGGAVEVRPIAQHSQDQPG